MYSSALTTKGQVTIPSHIRQQLHLQPGDKVGFILEDDHVVIFRKENDISAAFGLCKAKRSVSLAEMERAPQKKVKHDRN